MKRRLLIPLLFLSLCIYAQKPDTTTINPDSLTNGFTDGTSQFGVARDLSKLMGPNVAAFELIAQYIVLRNFHGGPFTRFPIALSYNYA